MKYKVVLRRSDEGFSTQVPALPGCWSQGKTEEEAIENIEDAIREYLAAIEESIKAREDQGSDVREIEVTV